MVSVRRLAGYSIAFTGAMALACEEPPRAQGPGQLTYQNGYAQTTTQANGQQTSFANGYGQRVAAPPPTSTVTYAPTSPTATQGQLAAPTATAEATPQVQPQQVQPVEIQTTPVPLGVQALPPPLPSATTTVAPITTPPMSTMATPGKGAFVCGGDAQCLLGKCNLQYGRCAYPCKHSELDCKAGNVCTASGLCMPRGAAGMSM